MSDSIQEARDQLDAAEAYFKERADAHKRRLEARNRLAYLTATAVVVVDNGHDVQCQGVSPEAEADIMRLRISVSSDNLITVTAYPGDSRVQIHLQPGGQVSFALSANELDDNRTYKVWAFADELDAGAWMTKRLAEFSSR